MKINTRELFERELQTRELSFSIDEASGRHVISIGDAELLISLDNLERDLERDGNIERVSNFVDAVVASAAAPEPEYSPTRLYWSLEPNDLGEPPTYRVAVSDEVDRVLVHLSEDGRLITCVSKEILDSLQISDSDAAKLAFQNLGQQLAKATLQSSDIDGANLAWFETSFPFKAAFILAPNLRDVVSHLVGWPVRAVTPDRNFLYLWPADRTDLTERIGPVAVKEYAAASYAISTEVYEISDSGIRAVGAYPKSSARSNKTPSIDDLSTRQILTRCARLSLICLGFLIYLLIKWKQDGNSARLVVACIFAAFLVFHWTGTALILRRRKQTSPSGAENL